MIIFGWGHQTRKNYGRTLINNCSHCNNVRPWELTKITTWFTLFFIPVFPYSIKYFLGCPICKYGVTLEGYKAEKMVQLAEANQLLESGKISDNEYKERFLNATTEAKPVDAQIVDSRSMFCAKCGTKITNDINFCGNCGMKVS